jgi:hypothetical protein
VVRSCRPDRGRRHGTNSCRYRRAVLPLEDTRLTRTICR